MGDVYENSQTVDPEVRAHVYSLVSAIGGNSNINDGHYALGDDALACLKDIGRWIRLYDDKTNRHDVKRCLAEANVVKGDLLEILAQWPETQHTSTLRNKIAVQCLDLLRELTWPMVLEEDAATVNHHRHLPFLQLAQVKYKRAVLQHETAQILRTVIRIVVPIISTPKEEKVARDWQVLNAALFFFRNIAIISQPQNLTIEGDENDVSRAATIAAFHDQDVLQLILTIASSINEEYPHQDIVIMELLFQLLKGINPNDLFKEKKQLDKDRNSVLKDLMDKEKALLASYNKNASSRHHRMGQMLWVKRPDQKLTTVSGQKIIFDESKTMDTMDKSKKWNKPKPRQKKTENMDETKDFAASVQIDERTRTILRTFVQDFLDSSFNPLFDSLRRAVSSEAERAKAYNSRQYYYLMGWFLQAERARQENIKKNKSHPAAEDSPFAYIAAVMTQENFVLLNRKMQQCLDDKEWSDLHACMGAFTEILHTVSAMSESSSEDDQEIAENIQSRIFYEETTHDLVIAILRNYKEQGFGYLDACTELSHVFIRMLERYSKQNMDLQIRSKRRARRKRKDAAKARGDDDNAEHSEQEGDDEVQAQRATSERKFDFTRYAVKFMTEPCINTFVRFTQYYADLNAEQLKRAHRFFYRCAFKMERIIYLFRVDILHLFNRMIKGSEALPKESEYFKDWEELVKQTFRRCIRKLQERPELMVEMLFTKMPQTIFYLEHGHDFVPEKRNPRPPAELVVKPGMTKEEEIGVVISVLVNQGKLDDIAWIKKVLGDAADERSSWEDLENIRASVENPPNPETSDSAENADKTDNPPEDPQNQPSRQPSPSQETSKASSIIVKPETGERKTALYKDKHLRLLLVLLNFMRIGASDDPEATWLIPSSLTSTELRDFLTLIKKLEFDLPTFGDGVAPETLLRNKSAAGLHARADKNSREASRANSASADNSDDGIGLSDIDELDERYGPGGPTARPASERPAKPARKRRLRNKAAADESDDEDTARQKAEERKKKEREKDAKIKSTIRVTDSDDEDDEARDVEFFRLEELRRGKVRGVIRNQLLREMELDKDVVEGGDGVGKSKGKGRKRKSDVGPQKTGKVKKRRTGVEEDAEAGDDDVGMSDEDPVVVGSRASSSEPDTEIRGGITQSHRSDDEDEEAVGKGTATTPVSGTKAPPAVIEDDDEDDDVVMITKPARRSTARGPFIVESDSE